MARSIYITSPEGATGKSTVALGLVTLLAREVANVGVFRPVVKDIDNDPTLDLLVSHAGGNLERSRYVGVTYEALHADPDAALAQIVDKFRDLERDCDVVVVDGSDYSDVPGGDEHSYNARVAANLGVPVLLVLSGHERTPEEIAQSAELSMKEISGEHAFTGAILVNRVAEGQGEAVRAALAPLETYATVLPDIPLLAAPSLADVMRAVEGSLFAGDAELLHREAESVLVCAMSPEHVLERIRDGQVAIAAGDRSSMLTTLLLAHQAENFPSLAGIVLNGGFLPSAQTIKLVEGLGSSLPVITTELATWETADALNDLRGVITAASTRKIELALSTMEEHLDVNKIIEALDIPRTEVVTPLMFQARLADRARAERKTIVLPEPEDDRVLRAASVVLARKVADLILLGDEAAVRARAAELGLDIAAARVISTSDETYLERYAAEFARLREKKGVTLEQAREIVQDVSYFGTMMVHMGDADGMVSGAAHTTAHTILPSFQIIKTKPGTSIVSSVFLMLMRDQVIVYGDCAVNPDPTAEQLADIAISSAATARMFGVDPRVAMLSYSTGESGSGADVDKVREATRLVRERAPELSVEGPIQYDAAVDAAVAKVKLPDSDVAGRATVFIFPDLNTGNIGYKAVQRSSGAIAVGPVLQGLNKPVNDLSRGALVDDIINTVVITAVQAQSR
ncbi:phosphate acetyltransferase [Buchananella hordeovulneris]|uniref:Phosphate acetyltransferase n=1 Tax=Buchananella hordeovulneris TaxID=52770 RepID=A0A1Q5PZ80_9ACTO|nr:phosphate acetyltransferase [Buchananella hordeovulneris]MDO5080182.1 phosphate acetyltransferase [Buchananella hordeovulneris]OKL52786.1 phosphate acetyltransferase [Buchananella hordeovulneris]RRD43631.1 phosphate acetyltransferase [Buchananella hordeovulneris]RRD52225.1 phosphate acetyltransferase [Buchananella hordeovulneris]